MRVIWSPLALDQIERIAAYIALDRPQAARAWVLGLFATVETLPRFPLKGRMVPEVGRDEIREIIYQNHRVIYKLEPSRVAILTVRHGKRRLESTDVSTGP